MANSKVRTRPGQKSVDFGLARGLIEEWCDEHAHIERTVLVAGWIALQMHDSETRLPFLKKAHQAMQSGEFDLNAFKKELEQVAKATSVQARPAGTSTANVSRPTSARAG